MTQPVEQEAPNAAREFMDQLRLMLEMAPISNFTFVVGKQRHSLRDVVLAISKQNVSYEQLVDKMQLQLLNVHHDLTIGIGALLKVSNTSPEAMALVAEAFASMISVTQKSNQPTTEGK